MRLSARFTIGFALAALVPITVAALVTREVVATSYRQDRRRERIAAEEAMRREVARLDHGVVDTVGVLADRDHYFVGGILRELVKGGGHLDAATQRRVKTEGGGVMRGIGLDVLTITGPDDHIVAAPHDRAAIGEGYPIAAARAKALPGKAFYTVEKVREQAGLREVLITAAAATARDSGQAVVVLGGRAVGADLLDSVRRTGQIDARVVDGAGRVIVAPAAADWARLSAVPPIRVALPGPDAEPVAWVEVAVPDRGLDDLLRRVTLVSLILAIGAVGATVLLGLIVARRMTRDLDRLVVGAQAAARGDLEHRVASASRDEVGAVASAFNLMMEDLRLAKERLVIAERIAAWQEIARRLAHEIKNPLTPIQMAMDTLRKTWKKKHPSFDEIFEESTATVLEEAGRLKRIVAEFSDFARLPKPEPGPCDLNEVVGSALALYQGAAAVERRLDARVGEIEADRGQLSQVLLNLIENARDAIATKGGDGGRIVVSTRLGDAGDRVELAVEDNGPGVPADLKDRLFTPYFTTKHGKGGTGLGLSIVHRIVADHGGRIMVADAAGGGARFVVELPLRQGQALLASRLDGAGGPGASASIPITRRP